MRRLRNRIVPSLELESLPSATDCDYELPDDEIYEASDPEDNVEDYEELMEQLIEWDIDQMMFGAGNDLNQRADEREFTSQEPIETLNDLRRRLGNIVREAEGLKAEGHVDTLTQALRLFITPHMAEQIAYYTNLHAKLINSDFEETDWVEIYAFIGILYMMGVQGDLKKKLSLLWNNVLSINFYDGVISRKRFQDLMSNMRFDEKRYRDPNDKFAPIREIFEQFNSYLPKYWKHSLFFVRKDDDVSICFRNLLPNVDTSCIILIISASVLRTQTA